jgi:hypothetical protein
MSRLSSDVLCDLLDIDEETRNKVVTAATIHDAFVLDEKSYVREKNKQGIKTNYQDLESIKHASAEKFKKIGFSEEVITMTDANITHEIGGPKEIPSQILFLVDAMLSGSEIVDAPKRFDLTRRGWRSDLGKFDEKTAESTQKYWNEFFKGAPGHGDEPHDIVQLRTAEKICRRFADILKNKREDAKSKKYDFIFGESGDTNMLPYYLEDRIKERLLNS